MFIVVSLCLFQSFLNDYNDLAFYRTNLMIPIAYEIVGGVGTILAVE